MPTYSICPLALCEFSLDASLYTYRMNFGEIYNTACYIWYIEGSQPKTMVDAGVSASMFAAKGDSVTELMSVEDGLATLGLKPDDIEIIILTHLHFDHIALGYLYPNAKFVVQKNELDYALHPHAIDAGLYEKATFEDLDMEVIDGKKEIIPGVCVFPTPGHTPGGQSVEVNTLAGRAIITGFCCTLRSFTKSDEMERWGWEVAVPLIHHDVRDAYDSILEVKRRADIVITLHDTTLVGKERIP